MKRRTYWTLAVAGAAAGCLALASWRGARLGRTDAPAVPTQLPSPAAQMQAAVAAVTAFLGTLSAAQRQQVQFPLAAQKTATAAKFSGMGGRMTFVGEQYDQAVWSNFPVSNVPRPGLRLGALSAVQRTAALHVLHVLLSPQGYQKVRDIMGSDQVLADGGTPYAAGEDTYTLGIFGLPSPTVPWLVQFGGHHLGLNVLIAGAHGGLTPTLTGAQPAVYQRQGRPVRVLVPENDKAFDLLAALSPTQRQQATLPYRVPDLVLGPGHDGEVLVPEGLQGSAMTAAQRAQLLGLILEWAGIIHPAYVPARLAKLWAGLPDTYIAWSGPTTHAPGQNGAAYYRIQGPKVLIEFAPQGTGGDLTQHVHTIYRDPTNAYGHALPPTP